MRILVRIIGAAFAVLLLAPNLAQADNPFGVAMRPAPGEDVSMLLARARGLGVAWFRAPTIILDQVRDPSLCPACAAFQRTGLRVALTVRVSGGNGTPSRPPADLNAFKRQFDAVLAAWNPDLVAIEDEEDSASSYNASGDLPAAYAVELNAACTIAHARKVMCTNGGMSERTAAGLTWLGYLKDGQAAAACDFAKRALAEGDSLCVYQTLKDVPPYMNAKLTGQGGNLLALYAGAPIDAVNFHWFGSDARAFAEIAAFLARTTRKPVLSSAMGQRPGHAEQANVRPLMRAAFASGLKLAMWVSIDGANSVSLFGTDGSLRPTGWEFQRLLSGMR